MQLSEEQLRQLRAWAAEGQSLSGIQKRMEDEFNLRMTYMQMRFLLDDYSIELANAPVSTPAPALTQQGTPSVEASGTDAPANVDHTDAVQETELMGGVSVEADLINRPGSVMSGDVTFSDGVKAKWYLDQAGRLGLDGVDKAYRPTPADIQDFQIELQKILQKKGY